MTSGSEPPIVKTESVKYDPVAALPGSHAHTTHVPVVQTETRKVFLLNAFFETFISNYFMFFLGCNAVRGWRLCSYRRNCEFSNCELKSSYGGNGDCKFRFKHFY
jgi:hypothetical protein